MIELLTKLANLLDDKSEHELASNIDKLANDLLGPRDLMQQEITSPTELPAPEIAPASAPTQPVKLQDVFKAIVNMVDKAGVLIPQQVSQQADSLFKELNDADEREHTSGKLKQSVIAVMEVLKEIADKANASNTMMDTWRDAANKVSEALISMSQATKPKHKPNALVMAVQKLLGTKQNGVWDIPTNTAFLAAIQKNYPQYLEGSTFKGDLKLAVQLLRNIEGLAMIDTPKEDNELL